MAKVVLAAEEGGKHRYNTVFVVHVKIEDRTLFRDGAHARKEFTAKGTLMRQVSQLSHRRFDTRKPDGRPICCSLYVFAEFEV